MAIVKFTKALQRFFPELQKGRIDGKTVYEVLNVLEQLHPGIKHYLVDEQGALREHINIFIGEELIHDRKELKDALGPDDEIYIFQALSGGCCR